MSYNAQMFKRLTKEINRIVGECELSCETDVDERDMYYTISALARLSCVFGKGYDLAANALWLATCEFGDMGDMLEEHEIIEDLVGQLMPHQGFEMVSDAKYTMWVRKED